MKSILIIIFLCLNLNIWAQSDSLYFHSRNKAALFSAIIPGAGQVYNEIGHRKIRNRKHISWWRAPIFIGGLAYTGYLSIYNANTAAELKKEWLYKNEHGESIYLFEKYKEFSSSDLIENFDLRAKYRDYAIAGFALIYVMNIVDAYVDAHFVTFDVSDDLSLNVRPKYFGGSEVGCSLSLNFK